ncbi:aspartate-semialdehyde dehydrogenase [Planctomycetota bacterium]
MSWNIAIVGATGAVGRELLKLLASRSFPVGSLRLFASSRSAGKTIKFKGESLPVEDVATGDYAGIDLAIFSAGAERSKTYAPEFVAAGAVVVDNSSAFRQDEGVPLVIPEINPEAIGGGIIANPNCSTIIAAMALWPLHRAFTLRRFRVATYQAVSGAGQAAIDELTGQNKILLENPDAEVSPQILPRRIAFNVIPQVDRFMANDYTKEEMKFVHETHKIFGTDSIAIAATCVRVPVLRAHAEAIYAEFALPTTPAAARKVLENAPGVKIMDNTDSQVYPMPIDASGRDEVLVGRLRKDISCDNGLAFWVVGDQLRKGAALNAIQIVEHIYTSAE